MEIGSLLAGIAIGLLVASIAIWVVNDFWHRLAQRQNKEWSEFCQEQNRTWANRCFELIGSPRRIPASQEAQTSVDNRPEES